MNNFTLSILLNSGVFVFLAVRYAAHMASRSGLFKLFAFVTTVFVVNLLLIGDRYSFNEAALRASSIATGFATLVFIVSVLSSNKQKK